MPGAAFALDFNFLVFARPCFGVCVAIRSTGGADTKASAPNAPWVAVCESPQTMVIPRQGRPVPAPLRGRSPDAGDSGHTARRQILLQFLISSCIWMRAISPQALMSFVWVETL